MNGYIAPDQQPKTCGQQKLLMDKKWVAYLVEHPRFWKAKVLGLHVAETASVQCPLVLHNSSESLL